MDGQDEQDYGIYPVHPVHPCWFCFTVALTRSIPLAVLFLPE